MRPHVAELSRVADTFTSACYPNAGLPNEFGGYDETPEYDGRRAGEFARTACSTSSAAAAARRRPTSRAIASRGAGMPPRPSPPAPPPAAVGLEPLTSPQSNFVNVGERTNVTGSARFRQADQGRRLRRGARRWPASRSRRRQIIDVNMDEGMLDGEAAMGASST
jgi:5-methyltetrahydrofolate--homocysteine methyltransferase